MKIDLTPDEAQALLDGINVVIKEQGEDLRFWRSTGIPKETKDQMTDELLAAMQVSKSARRKIQRVR